MRNQYNFNWSFGNSKLVKDGIVSFNIPALKAADGFVTCPDAGICAALCYAQQGNYNRPNVKRTREENIKKLRQMTEPEQSTGSSWGWVDVQAELQIDLDLMPKRVKRIRIHDSGDFYSLQYFDTWRWLAYENPHYIFYAYTKRISLYHQLRVESHIPDNFRIVQSYGGREDDVIDVDLSHSKIFATVEDLQASGYVDGTESDAPAYNGERCIGLVYHGVKRLTENQVTRLVNINTA